MSTIPPKTGRVQTPLPEGALDSVLAAHLPGARLLQAHRLSGGVSADVYRLDIETAARAPESVVLRIHGDHHNGHPAGLEFDILRAAAGLGLCAPRALALDESRLHLPHPYLLLEHIGGETVAPTNPDDPRIVRMAEALARVHAAPVAGLPALPARDDPLPELFGFLPQDTEFNALRAQLEGMAPVRCAGPATLLHGDFWPGNILWQDEQITGILDWEDAACGDPLSDVACTALELRYVAGREGAESFLRAYGRLRPIAPCRLALWQIYVAAAGQHSMGAWGLEPAREAHMRATALSVIREASALVT